MGDYSNLFNMTIGPLNLSLRAIVVYISVLILLRLGGKRQVGQMSPTEFVAVLLISNAVQNAMNGGDNSLSGGLLLAAVLIFMSWLISLLTFHSHKFSIIFEGTPTLLVHHSKIIEKNLSKERLTHNEFRTLLRKQGIHDIKEVESAILEADGSLSVTRVSEAKPK